MIVLVVSLTLIELEEQLFELALDFVCHLYVVNQLLAGVLT